MKIILEVRKDRSFLLLPLFDFYKRISFIKSIKKVDVNEIINHEILKAIHDFETGKVQPSPCNIEDLKALVHA